MNKHGRKTFPHYTFSLFLSSWLSPILFLLLSHRSVASSPSCCSENLGFSSISWRSCPLDARTPPSFGIMRLPSPSANESSQASCSEVTPFGPRPIAISSCQRSITLQCQPCKTEFMAVMRVSYVDEVPPRLTALICCWARSCVHMCVHEHVCERIHICLSKSKEVALAVPC